MKDLDKLSDEEIVELVRNNDKEYFSEIIRRYKTKLMRYSGYLINSNEKALDIVQETFIKAYINLNSFNTNKKFSSWIYRITHNQAMDEISKYRNEVKLEEDADFESEENIEENFDKNEIIKNINGCLNKIPVKYSEPLSLYYLEDKTYEEISDILRIPMGTVSSRINRAKGMLKRICQN